MSTHCASTSWTENTIRRVAGTMILVSVALGWFVHPGWFGFTTFVGANLVQSSFTGFCPLEIMLRRVDPTRETASDTSAR